MIAPIGADANVSGVVIGGSIVGHGVSLSEHIPDVDARLSADDGHLTLEERRGPEVHRWLPEQAATGTHALG